MRASRTPLPLRPLLAAAALGALARGAACDGAGAPITVSLAPELLFPRGLLDGATKVTVAVYDAALGVDCDATTGKLTAVATPFARSDLATTLAGAPCPSGGKFCGQLTVAKSSTARLFQAQASSAMSADLADGCTKAVIAEGGQNRILCLKHF